MKIEVDKTGSIEGFQKCIETIQQDKDLMELYSKTCVLGLLDE